MKKFPTSFGFMLVDESYTYQTSTKKQKVGILMNVIDNAEKELNYCLRIDMRSTRKTRYRYVASLFLLFYCLFVFNRIKYSFPIKINGTTINNVVLVIMIVNVILFLFYCKMRITTTVHSLAILALLVVQVGYSFIRGTEIDSAVYAALMMAVPFIGYTICSNMNSSEILSFFKATILISGIYAFLTLIISSNYSIFATYLGVAEIETYVKFARVNMPIGSSITVSYYLNITTPFCIIGFNYFNKNKKWKIISLVSLVLSLVCILLMNSRAAIIIMICVSFLYYIYKTKKREKNLNAIVFLALAGVCVFFYLKYGDVSRFFNRANTVIESDNTRFHEFLSSLRIFMDYPIFGTGIGAIYERAFTSRYITYAETTLLSDPHNAYGLLLSEFGFLGSIMIVAFVVHIFRRNKQNKSKAVRFLSNSLLCCLLLQALFGSHIINEPSIAFIYWGLLGLVAAIIKNDGGLGV